MRCWFMTMAETLWERSRRTRKMLWRLLPMLSTAGLNLMNIFLPMNSVKHWNCWTDNTTAALRKVLFQITEVYILNKLEDEPVYQFIDKKRSEGKHYYSYRIAAANKFLRIYFAKVNQVLNSQQPPTYLLIRLLQFFVWSGLSVVPFFKLVNCL